MPWPWSRRASIPWPGLYWIGGVVQNAPVTQPTLRTITMDLTGLVPLTVGTPPIANHPAGVGFVGFGMTGAFPSTWPTATPNISQQAVRVFVKTA